MSPTIWHCNVCGFIGPEEHIHRRDMKDPESEYGHQTRVLRFEEWTREQRDRAYMHHAATGGDMAFLADGRSVAT